MKNVFITDLKIIEDILGNDESGVELSAPFKDSLVVYSFKEKLESFDELKSVVNSYRYTWEEVISNPKSSLEDYNQIINDLERLGTIISFSKEIGITGNMIKPAKIYQDISVFLENFEGEVILWNNDITGDPHILGLGKDTNFFTINNYL